MQAELWRRLEDLYHNALQIDPPGRVAFLEAACAEDDVLRREVDSLLANDQAAEHFLELSAMEHAGKLLARDLTAADTPAADRTIGPYRLLSQLGEGGMGEVWLAEQSDPVRRRVALKVVRAGMDTREAVARFESERQALALMDHPAVAKVFDGGSTSSGLPYFVMEYVPGMPITDWCDRYRLTIPEKLELFVQVCEGVKHAHQKAIIHRDLKPSNILVTDVDGKARPRIIDFGIVKAVAQKLAEETLLTRAGLILGTPEYMSPEQADSTGVDIDTRTDVYSLGALLYQLLVGAPPIELKALSLEEMLRRLREDDPPRPSTKLQTLGYRSHTPGDKGAGSSAALARLVRGDLDSIVMKALEKTRERRYESVADLAADIGRYLRHEPVLARRQSSWYRMGMFVRRHRWAVAAGMSVAFALTAGLSAALWEAHLARAQAQVAKREAQTSSAVQQFIMDIFETNSRDQPDPLKARQTTARQLLDIGVQRINTGLDDAPAAKEKMLGILAELDYSLGLEDPAVELDRKRVAVVRALYGSNDSRVADALCDLASVMASSRSANQRESVLLEAKRILDTNRDFTPTRRGNLLRLLSNYYRNTDRQKSLDFARQAVAFYRTLPPSHLLAEALANEGVIYGFSSQAAQAEPLFAEAAHISRTFVGDHDPALPLYAAYLGQSDSALMHYEAAGQNFELALKSARVLNGEEHVDTAETEARLGTFFSLTSQNAEALRELKQALDVCLKLKGMDDPLYTPQIMFRYSEALINDGQFEDGLTSISHVLENQRRNRPGTRFLGQILTSQASVLEDLGEYDQARRSLEQAATIANRVGYRVASDYAAARIELALESKSPDEAERLINDFFGPPPPDRAPLSLDLLRNLTARVRLALFRNDADDALRLARLLSRLITENPDRKYLKLWEKQAALAEGNAFLLRHDAGKALPPLLRAVQLDREMYNSTSAELIAARTALATAYAETGNRAESLNLLAQAETVRKYHPRLGERFEAPFRGLCVKDGSRCPSPVTTAASPAPTQSNCCMTATQSNSPASTARSSLLSAGRSMRAR